MVTTAVLLPCLLLFGVTFANADDAEDAQALKKAAADAQPLITWVHGHARLLQETEGIDNQVIPNWSTIAKLIADGKATKEQKKKVVDQLMAVYFLGSVMVTEMSDIIPSANIYLEGLKNLGLKLSPDMKLM